MPKCPTCGCTSIVLFGEIKRPGKDATDLQLLEHEAMREAGLVVEVFDDPDDLDVALALLDSRAGRSVFD